MPENNNNIDADIELKKVRAAKNAVREAVKSGKLKKPDKCSKCNSHKNIESHHHLGYDEEHQLHVIWLCSSCHHVITAKDKHKKKGDSMPVNRIDFFDIGPDTEDNFLEEPFRLNNDGYLQGRAVVTNIGVFNYLNEDGTIRRELRLPEDVLNFDSLDSLRMKPLTNDHPSELVKTDNIKDVQVGSLGDSWRVDSYKVSYPIVITEQDAMDDVKNGKRALSCAYFADIEETEGVYLGQHYDAIQRNIRYNHVAIVDRARAGDATRIRMDGVKVMEFDNKNINSHKGDGMPNDNLKKIVLDGADYQAEGPVIQAYTKVKAQVQDLESTVKTLNTDHSKIEGERDSLKERADKLDKEVKELRGKKIDVAELNQLVKARVIVLDAAKIAGIEVKEDDSNINIMKAVIIKHSPNAKEKMDKGDADYVQAYFDGVQGSLKEEGDAAQANAGMVSDSFDNVNATPDGESIMDAYTEKVKSFSRSKGDA